MCSDTCQQGTCTDSKVKREGIGNCESIDQRTKFKRVARITLRGNGEASWEVV